MIQFVRMTQCEYETWIQIAVDSYAAAKATSGVWDATEAPEKAKKVFGELLSEGLDTPNHHLVSVRDSEQGVLFGYLWFAVEGSEPHVFLYEITILPDYRRRGVGRQAMKELEAQALKLGLHCVSLHVFADNVPARLLYESLGYVPSGTYMTKNLIDGDAAAAEKSVR